MLKASARSLAEWVCCQLWIVGKPSCPKCCGRGRKSRRCFRDDSHGRTSNFIYENQKKSKLWVGSHVSGTQFCNPFGGKERHRSGVVRASRESWIWVKLVKVGMERNILWLSWTWHTACTNSTFRRSDRFSPEMVLGRSQPSLDNYSAIALCTHCFGQQ